MGIIECIGIVLVFFSICGQSEPNLKDIFGDKVLPRKETFGNIQCLVLEGAIPAGQGSWEDLSKEVCRSPRTFMSDSIVTGNKRFLPKIVKGDEIIDSKQLYVLLKPLKAARSTCCAARCGQFFPPVPVSMQSRHFKYNATIGCEDFSNNKLYKLNVEFIGDKFDCACSNGNYANHRREKAECHPNIPDMQFYCCDYQNYIYNKCPEIPEWARYRIKFN